MASESSAEISGAPRRSTVWDLFQPQDLSRRRRTHAPEERLMIAVLHDAIDCIEKYRFATERQGRRVFHEAKRWFRTHDPDWPYSFERICEVLNLDPFTVRRRLATPTVAGRASRVLVDAPVYSVQDTLRSVGD